jgi:hypothetical protein
MNTATTLEPVLGPLAIVTPSSEALVEWIITGKMAVPDQSFLVVATGSECDLLVEAHCGCIVRSDVLVYYGTAS